MITFQRTLQKQDSASNGSFECQRTMKKINEIGNLAFENEVKVKEKGKTVYFAKDISGYLIK